MDLSFLIPSKVRRKVLEFFVNEPNAQLHVRELARELNLSPQLTYRELINLENWGFLFSSKRGNQRVYRLNEKFIFNQPIKMIFQNMADENSQKYVVKNTFDWKKLSKKYDKIPISKNLASGLTAKETKPRSYEEEKILKRKKLLWNK